MEKAEYERIKDIKRRMFKGEPTTYQERQHAYIYDTRQKKKKKEANKKKQ